MHYQEEIQYREELQSQARNGKKISKEERLWLVTHPLYNFRLGFPHLNADILSLGSTDKHLVTIQVEEYKCPDETIPLINVPGNKGSIMASTTVYDYNGNAFVNKPVKTLGVLVNNNHRKSSVIYQSSLGMLGVSFQCTYYDFQMNLMIRKSSNVGDPNYAMLKEPIYSNKVLYKCKTPVSDNFNSFVFSIEWKPWDKGVCTD